MSLESDNRGTEQGLIPVWGSPNSNGSSTGPTQSTDQSNGSDESYSRPAVTIDLNEQPYANCVALGRALAPFRQLYRNPAYRGGLLVEASGRCYEVRTPKQLAPLIADLVDVDVIEDGELKSHFIANSYLDLMLGMQWFLRWFLPVDTVTAVPGFTDSFELLQPGYNAGPPGTRIYYAGPTIKPAKSLDAINRFLDVMDFESDADRTGAVAGALTVVNRHRWPGAKPMILAQGSKSHSGKDTVVDFACGVTPAYGLSFQPDQDWPMEKNVARVLTDNPSYGVFRFDNVRLDRTNRQICSIFIERFITSAEVVLYTTGTGKPAPVYNSFVVGMSTNEGSVSEDLLNRSLRIMLSPKGDVADRKSPIGNPRWTYLPQYRLAIQAELLGIVERWVASEHQLGSVAYRHLIWQLRANHRGRC